MPNFHPCVLTQSETLWLQHKENLRLTRINPPQHGNIFIHELHKRSTDLAKNYISSVNDEISDIRGSLVDGMPDATESLKLIKSQMALLEPILGDFKYELSELENNKANLVIDKGVISHLVQIAPLHAELLHAFVKLFDTVTQISRQIEYVMERIEIDCKVLADDSDIMDHLDDGDALPRSKSVAAQYDEGEIIDPGQYSLLTAHELIKTENSESITLTVQSMLESFNILNNSIREVGPILQEATKNLLMKRVKVEDDRRERQRAEKEKETTEKRRNSFTLVK